MAATYGNASSAVVSNNDVKNIELQTGHTDDEAEDTEDILIEGWSMDIFKENDTMEVNINNETTVGKVDGQTNTVNKPYKKSSNATKKKQIK